MRQETEQFQFPSIGVIRIFEMGEWWRRKDTRVISVYC